MKEETKAIEELRLMMHEGFQQMYDLFNKRFDALEAKIGTHEVRIGSLEHVVHVDHSARLKALEE